MQGAGDGLEYAFQLASQANAAGEISEELWRGGGGVGGGGGVEGKGKREGEEREDDRERHKNDKEGVSREIS